MRVVLAALAAPLLVASLAAGAVADDKPAKKQRADIRKAMEREHRPRSPAPDAFVQRDANKLPFGSAIWWDQMQREGRLGGEMP